jgi:hypothetical protein
VPSSKLLVFDVRDGWAPLCDFLGVPTPIPHVNNATAVRRFMTAIRVGTWLLPVAGLYLSARLLRNRLTLKRPAGCCLIGDQLVYWPVSRGLVPHRLRSMSPSKFVRFELTLAALSTTAASWAVILSASC